MACGLAGGFTTGGFNFDGHYTITDASFRVMQGGPASVRIQAVRDTDSGTLTTLDGSTVAFQSYASDMAGNDGNGGVQDVFVRDLQTGRTTLASINTTKTVQRSAVRNTNVIDSKGCMRSV